MSYLSIDCLQNALGETVFAHTKDSKKAAGRALGTLVEIITYYLLREWGLRDYISIERPLPEYGNAEITHNVEFSLNPLVWRRMIEISTNTSITAKKLAKALEYEGTPKSASQPLFEKKRGLLKNAFLVSEENHRLLIANANSVNDETADVSCVMQLNYPFAMFECKRVGIEEGAGKGPQTIEKAKQGAYVAKMISSLQKIRDNSGHVYGVIYENGKSKIEPYNVFLRNLIESDSKLLKDFILSVGIVSNHGNWFTSGNQNKEMKVLSQSYDWLLFLTDNGLSRFITDLLLNPSPRYKVVADAFKETYSENKIKGYCFTKTKLDIRAHRALVEYFHNNIDSIEGWFNVITNGKTIVDLKGDLNILKNKNWEEIL